VGFVVQTFPAFLRRFRGPDAPRVPRGFRGPDAPPASLWRVSRPGATCPRRRTAGRANCCRPSWHACLLPYDRLNRSLGRLLTRGQGHWLSMLVRTVNGRLLAVGVRGL